MKFDVTSLFNRRAVNRYERVSVGDVMERVTWSFPDKEALIAWEGACAGEKTKRVTYRQADGMANQFANALLERGLKRGDRVLFYCASSVEFFLAQVGAAKAGLVAVPLNVMIAIDLLDYVIKHTEPKFLVVDAELYPRGEKVFRGNGLEVGVTIPIGGGAIQGSKSFADFINGKPKSEPEVEIHGDDIFQILFTAGTTALPKGVMHSHIYMYFCAIGWAMSHGRGVMTETDIRAGVFYPIFHIACQGMTYAALLSGGTALIARRPDPQAMIEAIDREKITWIFGSPADYYRIADIIEQNPGKYDLGSFKVAGYGWGAFRPDYDKKLRKIFGKDLLVIGNDGQTECVYDNRMWHHMWYEKYEKNEPAVNYLGVPHPFYATTVLDDNGNICPPGVMGHKVMRSPVMMAGYYKNEEATREAFEHGWFHGGDAAMYDEDGLLIMVDRYKDIIKSGGENVSSLRVEQVIRMHPKVANAAVIGIPHERWLEAVTACVIPKPGENPTEEELIAYCRERLAGYETPKNVVFMDKFPETVGGKIQKYILRKELQDLYRDKK
ncbi:MAG: AMP-binding protein [Bacillota bacterium]